LPTKKKPAALYYGLVRYGERRVAHSKKEVRQLELEGFVSSKTFTCDIEATTWVSRGRQTVPKAPPKPSAGNENETSRPKTPIKKRLEMKAKVKKWGEEDLKALRSKTPERPSESRKKTPIRSARKDNEKMAGTATSRSKKSAGNKDKKMAEELVQVRGENERLRDELEEKKGELDEYEAMAEEFVQVRGENERLRDEVEEKKGELDELEEMAEELVQVRGENERLRDELEEKKGESDELEEMAEELVQVRGENERLRDELEEKKGELVRAREENVRGGDRVRGKLDTMEQKLRDAIMISNGFVKKLRARDQSLLSIGCERDRYQRNATAMEQRWRSEMRAHNRDCLIFTAVFVLIAILFAIYFS